MDQNCRVGWSEASCVVGNVASTVSTVMWFTVLVPQLLRNHRRRSVEGLSFLWALANFTASVCNAFCILPLAVPVQVHVMAVYMPILEAAMLCQFLCSCDAGVPITVIGCAPMACRSRLLARPGSRGHCNAQCCLMARDTCSAIVDRGD